MLVPRLLYMEACKDHRQHALIVHNYSSVVDGRGNLFLNAVMEFKRPAKAFSMVGGVRAARWGCRRTGRTPALTVAIA